jgi:predicted enzyme related to lactoylglutathione lyase
MARLRHFAIVVRDLENSAKFYENAFELKRVGQETLDFAFERWRDQPRAAQLFWQTRLRAR